MDQISADVPDLGCSFPECERPFRARHRGEPYCKSHYTQACERTRTGAPLRPIRPKQPAGKYTGCKFNKPQCDREHSSNGYCSTHYQQWNDSGKDDSALKPIRGWKSQAEWGPICRYRDCQEPPHSRGLCSTHYGRGISQFARDAILALQNGVCLCGTSDPGERGWHLDHDHAHNCPRHEPGNYCPSCARAMLCINCNRHGLGWYENTWRRMGNAPIPVLEEWSTRRIEFHGAVDSPEVTVSYALTNEAIQASS
ncbi:endonuclease domain-containing protein [Streptomyces sp. NPDC005077]|uniref:endonuclease domain-containing protein n=1 Tax=Streptomyces sp. NPDC005077 TaxID=3154292 RepID=UPI0033AF6218